MRMRKIRWAADYLDEAACRFQDPAGRKQNWNEILQTGGRLHVEIGTGKGNYSLQMSRLYPQDGFVAIEKNESAAGLAAKKFDEAQPEHLKLIYGDAAEISSWFAPGEVDVIHLNFSDPWPKRRNTKRRLSSPAFLEQYKTILSDDGEIQMKTDNSALFEYSLLSMLEAGFQLADVSVDFRREEHPEDAITEYEEKFIAAGQPIYRSVWKKGKQS